MRIAFTGPTSSLVRYLVRRLSKTAEVITVGRNKADIVFDLESPEELCLPENIDVLVHAAAAVSEGTDGRILNMLETNVKGSLKVCMAAQRAGVGHVIYISSIYAALDRDAPYYSYYAMTKRQAEEACAYYCKRYAIPFTSLRPAPFYGAEDFFRKNQPLLYLMADRAEKGQDIVIYGNCDALRNYLYITDLVEVISGVMEQKVVGCYPVLYPVNYKLSEVAEAALRAFAKGGRVLFRKEKENISDNPFYDEGELYRKLQIFPEVSIEEGMRRIRDERRKKNRQGG